MRDVSLMQQDPNQIADLAALQELIARDVLLFVFEGAQCPAFILDATTFRFVAVNASGRALVGRDQRQLRKLGAEQVLANVTAERLSRFLSAVRFRPSARCRARVKLGITRTRDYDVTVNFLDSERPSFAVQVKEVAREEVALQKAATAEAMLMTAIETLPDGFVIYDDEDRLVICNERYLDFYAESAEAMRPGARFEDILRHGLQRFQYAEAIGREEEWLAERLTARGAFGVTLEQRLSDGRWLRVQERRLPHGGHVGLRIDITELKRQQEELYRLARVDELTGLLNRIGLSERMEAVVSVLPRGERLAIFHLDLNRFKIVNDVVGHDAGDHILKYCARVLCEDAPLGQLTARVGGDEFIVVRKVNASDASVRGYAEALVAKLSRPIHYDSQIFNIAANVGVAFIHGGADANVKEALTGSDIALNKSKILGENAILFFEPSMRAQTLRDSVIMRDIQTALEKGQFCPYFQPQVNIATGEVTGFEALIRWVHPERGIIPASQFLETAQRTGKSQAMDGIVMDQSCAAIRTLLDAGMPSPCISINLSPSQISDPTVVRRLTENVQKYGLSPAHIRVELLESTLLDERSSTIVENVHAIIAAGFEVELDDFGTGHAAIATLRKFDVSQIKIDRSFVQHIDTDKDLQVITAAMIDLAHRLGIEVLAEGVETQAEQAMLESMGCYIAQGYLHARPMPLSEVLTWLDARQALTPVTPAAAYRHS